MVLQDIQGGSCRASETFPRIGTRCVDDAKRLADAARSIFAELHERSVCSINTEYVCTTGCPCSKIARFQESREDVIESK
jgi:hypothetical protein